MKKLDWYIFKKFLTTFFFCVFLFTMIAVVIDVSEKTDDFVKSGLSFSQIFTQYYLGFIPYIDALLFPLFVLIAVIFFTSKMACAQRNNCHTCQWHNLFKNAIFLIGLAVYYLVCYCFFHLRLLYQKPMQNGD